MTSGTIDKSFVDTNVLIHAHDVDAGGKHDIAADLLRPLWAERTGLLSTQVLLRFNRPLDAREPVLSIDREEAFCPRQAQETEKAIAHRSQ